MIKHFILCLFLFPLGIKAQESQFEISFFSGPHANHKNDPVFIDNAKGLAFNWLKTLDRNSGWPMHLHCNSFGISLIVYDFSQLKGGHAPIPTGLGQSISIIPNIEIELWKRNRYNFILNPGVGIGFNNNTFQNHSENRFISTAVNNTFMVNFILGYALKNENQMRLSFRAYHTSNGAVRTPNEGLNIVNIGLGYLW
jgi:hypothetical protein